MIFVRNYVVAVLALVTTLSNAEAAVISFTDTITPPNRTNYVSSLSLGRFDPSLGTLQSVSVALSGSIVGVIRIESEEGEPVIVTENIQAAITLLRPNGSSLALVIPFESIDDYFTAYDGVTDFAGTSGITRSGVTATQDVSVTTSTPEDLALFTGTTNIALPLSATSSSLATGSGNIVTAFTTFAGASATVDYIYQEAATPPIAQIPEPNALALLGIGLLGLSFVQRRR